jgi:hypothetical protein
MYSRQYGDKIMDSLRSKHQFDYDSNDFKFPYQPGYYGTKKVVVFNYSPQIFRRKSSGGLGGLYYIQGGNIPSDMASSALFDAPPSGDTPVKIVCSLNKGTATRIRRTEVLNLSPNDIPLYPTLCDSDPYKLIPVHWEIGQNHKPNFAYLPAYQYSCSDHPRSSGYAHEDNYDCLKSLKDAGTPKGVCCDEVAGCISRASIFTKGPENPYGPDSGKFRFDDGANAGGGQRPQASLKYCLQEGNKLEECGYEKSCDMTISYGNSMTNVSACGNFKINGYAGFDGVCGCIYQGTDLIWYPANSYTTRRFHLSGNKDCGCAGARAGGAVYVNGYTDCQYCERWCTSISGTGCPPGTPAQDANGQPYTKPASSGGRVCTKVTMASQKYCACNFTFPWAPSEAGLPRYITTFQYPTFQFSNWAGMAPGGGGLTSVPCDSTYHTDCGEIP